MLSQAGLFEQIVDSVISYCLYLAEGTWVFGHLQSLKQLAAAATQQTCSILSTETFTKGKS